MSTSRTPRPLLRSSPQEPRSEAASPLIASAIGAVLCASLLLNILLATGPIGSDDIVYFRGATQILHGGWLPGVDTLVGRKLFILLVGIPAAIGGHIIYGVVTNIFVAMALELAVIAFVFREFGPASALVAAIVAGLNGVTLLWSGTMMSDITVALPMFLSVASLYYALSPNMPRRALLLVFSGALAGLANAIKEPGILLLPPAAASILFLPDDVTLSKRAASGGLYLLGFVCLLAAECLVQLWLSGDFFLRYHGLQSMQPNPAMPLYEFLRWDYWSLAGIVGRYRDILLLPLVAGLLSWIAVVRMRSAISVFGLTGLFVASYLIFGSTSLSALHPMNFQTRYFAPLFPLIAVSMGAVFARVKFASARLAMWIFTLAFAFASAFGATAEAGDLGRARYFRNAAVALEFELANARSPIMVDASTIEVLAQFMPRSALVKLKPLPMANEPLRPGLYLVDPYQDSIIRQERAPHFEEIMNLPIVATINMNPFVLSHYFLNFNASRLDGDPRFVAIVREMRPGL